MATSSRNSGCSPRRRCPAHNADCSRPRAPGRPPRCWPPPTAAAPAPYRDWSCRRRWPDEHVQARHGIGDRLQRPVPLGPKLPKASAMAPPPSVPSNPWPRAVGSSKHLGNMRRAGRNRAPVAKLGRSHGRGAAQPRSPAVISSCCPIDFRCRCAPPSFRVHHPMLKPANSTMIDLDHSRFR